VDGLQGGWPRCLHIALSRRGNPVLADRLINMREPEDKHAACSTPRRGKRLEA
jgi:hypothetical protein